MSAANRNRLLAELQAAEARRLQRAVAALPSPPRNLLPSLWALPSPPTTRVVIARRAGETLANKMRRIQDLQRQVRRQRRRRW